MLTVDNDYADTTTSYHEGQGKSTPDTFKFTSGTDTVIATEKTLTAKDVFVDGTAGDGDVLQLNLSADVKDLDEVVGLKDFKSTGIEVLNIHSNGAGSGGAAMTYDASAGGSGYAVGMTGVETLKFTGGIVGDLDITSVNASLKTIDLSALSVGNVDIDASAATNVVINGNGSNATVTGGDGNDTITWLGVADVNGSGGNDIITANGSISGGEGNDTITLNGASTVNGEAGNDTVYGSDGNDIIVNGSGTVSGVTGADVFTGGAGADKFYFAANTSITNAALSTKAEMDIITDFSGSAGQKDQIMLKTWEDTSKVVAYSGNKTTFDEILKDLSKTSEGAGTPAQFVIDFSGKKLAAGSTITITDPATNETFVGTGTSTTVGDATGVETAKLFDGSTVGGYKGKADGAKVTFEAQTAGKVASALTATSTDTTNLPTINVLNGPNGMGTDPAEGTPANGDIVYFELDGNTYAAQITDIASGFQESSDFLVQLTGTNLGLTAADFAAAQ